jgi:hypothetical protein
MSIEPNPLYHAAAPGDLKSVLAVAAGVIIGNVTMISFIHLLMWLFP